MRIKTYGSSDTGRIRKNNQDAFYHNADHGLVIVADGIGGRNGGEVASSTAVKGITKRYLNCETLRREEISPFIISAIDHVNKKIIQKGETDPYVKGMGTTLDCLFFVGETVYIAHVGDSRSYLYYKGNMWLLTLDHTMEVFVERGWLPRESLSSSKPGALVRALGLTENLEIDIYEKTLRPGEVLLTCSDGLTGMVSDQKITSLIKANEHHLELMPKILVAEANKNGGRDNITVVITKVEK